MDEDDLTVDDRFRSRDIGKGSDDIISAIRDIIDADKALLETDPEAVLVSERTEARLRAALERLTGGSDTPPPWKGCAKKTILAHAPIWMCWMLNRICWMPASRLYRPSAING